MEEQTRTGKASRFRPEWLLIASLAALALLARLAPGQRTVDDAYITFRYARNIVEGIGFVYNPGEHVLGTTTPLYTLLMAALALAANSRDFPLLALIVNALAGAASTILVYILGSRVADHPVPAASAALLWAIAPYSVSFAVGGMETDLTIALLLACAAAHIAGRPRILAILSALTLLARPDTAILLGLLWLDLLIARRRLPWREGLITLVLLAPWLIFGTLTFGSPVTASIAAKSVAYHIPPLAALIRLVQHYSTPFFENALLGARWQIVGFAVYLLLCITGGLRAIKRSARTWPLLAYPYLYAVVFAIANPLIFRWYLSPPLPFYFVFICTGVWTVLHDVGEAADRGIHGPTRLQAHAPRRQPVIHRRGNLSAGRFAHLAFALLTAAALALTLNAWEMHPDHGPERPAPEMAWFGGELIYRQIALNLKDSLEPGDVVAIADIGTFGYYSDAIILDPVGLVSPVASQYHPLPASQVVDALAVPTQLILDRQPDYVVMLEVYIRHTLLESASFDAQYTLIDEIETDILDSSAFMVFARNGSHADEPGQ